MDEIVNCFFELGLTFFPGSGINIACR
jgi:hypothetical protein